MTPIAQAVAPLKTEAVARAVALLRNRLEAFAAELVGSNLAETAAFPKGTFSKKDYTEGKNRYHLARSILVVERESSRHGAPEIAVAVNTERVELLVAQGAEDAAAEFDAYVAKLEGKVGECDAAEIDGHALWRGSTLTVRKGELTEKWVTKQIINFSSLGKAFNQWPTRLAK